MKHKLLSYNDSSHSRWNMQEYCKLSRSWRIVSVIFYDPQRPNAFVSYLISRDRKASQIRQLSEVVELIDYDNRHKKSKSRFPVSRISCIYPFRSAFVMTNGFFSITENF